MMIAQLAAYLTAAVIAIEKERPGIFGKSGANAQVYALLPAQSVLGCWQVLRG